MRRYETSFGHSFGGAIRQPRRIAEKANRTGRCQPSHDNSVYAGTHQCMDKAMRCNRLRQLARTLSFSKMVNTGIRDSNLHRTRHQTVARPSRIFWFIQELQ